MLPLRYLIIFYSFSYICFLPISFSLFLFYVHVLAFPCSLYQRGWDCTVWAVSRGVGVSLCVDIRLCRVLSCTWPVGDALASRDLASGVWGRAVQCLPRFFCCILLHIVCSRFLYTWVGDCRPIELSQNCLPANPTGLKKIAWFCY